MNDRRAIKIRLEGPSAQLGHIRAQEFADVISNLQSALFRLGKAKERQDPSKPGPHDKKIEEGCTIVLSRLEPGSLEIFLELPKEETEMLPNMPPTLGEETIESFSKVWQAVEEEDVKGFKEAVGDDRYLRRILNDINHMFLKDPQTVLSIKSGAGKMSKPVKKLSREFINRASGPQPTEEPAPEEVMIQAYCKVNLGKEGKIQKVNEWIDFSPIEEETYCISEIHAYGKTLNLNWKIKCEVVPEDDLVVIIYRPLRIRAFAETIEAAKKEFNELFVILWKEYALESDANLTGDAMEFKQHLLGLVKEEQ